MDPLDILYLIGVYSFNVCWFISQLLRIILVYLKNSEILKKKAGKCLLAMISSFCLVITVLHDKVVIYGSI